MMTLADKEFLNTLSLAMILTCGVFANKSFSRTVVLIEISSRLQLLSEDKDFFRTVAPADKWFTYTVLLRISGHRLSLFCFRTGLDQGLRTCAYLIFQNN